MDFAFRYGESMCSTVDTHVGIIAKVSALSAFGEIRKTTVTVLWCPAEIPLEIMVLSVLPNGSFRSGIGLLSI
jgi:hypothetical protein